MTLHKRYARGLRANLAFYGSAAILTMVTLMVFYLFYIGGTGIHAFGEEFFTGQSLEDAAFTTYLPISEEELEALEQEYHVVLEAQHSLDLQEGETTARIFTANEKIDLYAVTQGQDLAGDDEILLSEGYAVNLGIAIGDRITLQGTEFTVVGYFQRPDYLYMLQEVTDSYKNITTFFLGYVTEAAFEGLGSGTVTYLVQYEEDNAAAFRTEVNARYAMQSYLSAQDNMRIQMVPEQADLFLTAAWVLLVLLPLVAVVLVSIMIARKMQEEQRSIGTLRAFGYSKGQIMLHYAGFAVLPGLVGGLLAFVLAAVFAQRYGELCLTDYEPLHAVFTLPVGIGLVGILVPAGMYLLSAVMTAQRLLRHDTAELLRGQVTGKGSLRTMLRRSKLPFGTKFALRSLLGNPARAFAILLGIFLSATVALFCFGMLDSVNNVSATTLEQVGSFEYEYILNARLTEAPEEGSPMLVATFETASGESLTLMGLAEENPYLNLRTLEGEAISTLAGYYASSAAAAALHLQAGDSLTLYNPLSLAECSITIAETADYPIGTVIFTSMDALAELLELEAGTYNAVMSETAIDWPDGLVQQTIRKSAIAEQCSTILDQMGVIYYTVLGLGVVICVAAIYAVVNLMIRENRSNLQLLKVLGYREREMKKIVLRTNHILLPLGFLLGIPAARLGLSMLWALLMDYGVMLIETHIRPVSYLFAFAVTAGCYAASLALAGRRLGAMNLEEALKDRQE